MYEPVVKVYLLVTSYFINAQISVWVALNRGADTLNLFIRAGFE
jgi:hypothetical protein